MGSVIASDALRRRAKQSHTSMLSRVWDCFGPWGLAMTVVTIVAFLLIVSTAQAQDNTIRVVFSDNPDSNTVIGAFRTKGVLYGSLTDLVHVLQVGSYTNPTTPRWK